MSKRRAVFNLKRISKLKGGSLVVISKQNKHVMQHGLQCYFIVSINVFISGNVGGSNAYIAAKMIIMGREDDNNETKT